MKEIISGLWTGNANDLLINKNSIHHSIDCNFNDSYLSIDLQQQQFIDKHDEIVSKIHSSLNQLQTVLLYNSNSNYLENHYLIIIAFFVKYTNIKINNLLILIKKKIKKPLFKNYNQSVYQKIITELVNYYRR